MLSAGVLLELVSATLIDHGQGFYWIADEHAASIAQCIWPFADDRGRM